MRIARTLLIVFIGAVFLLMLTVVAGQDEQPRTFYEALDLSSPESAVSEFVDAFQRRDYVSVYTILSYDAQSQIVRATAMFSFDNLFRAEDSDQRDAVMEDSVILGQGIGADVNEHSPEGIFMFDDIMLAAEANDAFLIDLRGEVEIAEGAAESDDGMAEVSATVEGIEGDVLFIMEQSPSERWRVRQVIAPGGDGENLPWSVPEED